TTFSLGSCKSSEEDTDTTVVYNEQSSIARTPQSSSDLSMQDPQLVELIGRWPKLPPEVRAGLLAMANCVTYS
ncbi:MAG: hypothetical protein KDA29_01000, partial [Phycisphaerales bacterium]|nr:hypothetical protein [Phycisphaerales bacterium]